MDIFDIPDDYVPEKPLTNEQMDQNTNYLKNHPLFLKELPQDISSNPHLVALQSMMDYQDPNVTAQNLNKQANTRLKQGPNSLYYMKQAYAKYTQAINLKCSSKQINAKLHSNRSSINLKYRNYGKVIEDCKLAINFDPGYVKAYYRIAKAYIALKRYDDCINILQKQTDPQILKLTNQAKHLKEESIKVETTIKTKLNSQSSKIEEYFKQNKWVLGKRSEQLPEGAKIQFIDNKISIPLVVIYPQFSQFDLIASTEPTQKIGQHIKQLFTSKLPWDTKGEYNFNTIEQFLELEEAVLLKLPKQATINQLAGRVQVKGAIEIIIIANNEFGNYYKGQHKIY